MVQNNQPAYSYSQYYKNPLVKVYNNFDIDLIKQDIANFLVSEGLPTTAFIGSIQIVGGYDKNTEDSTKTYLFNLELKTEEYLEIRRMVIEKFGSIEQSQMVIFNLEEYLFDY